MKLLPSEQLVRALFELSGWEGEYTLGALLRKLPPTLHHLSLDEGDGLWLVVSAGNEAKFWVAGYGNENPVNQIEVHADTPEDAAALLAIALFKQGILPQLANEGQE